MEPTPENFRRYSAASHKANVIIRDFVEAEIEQTLISQIETSTAEDTLLALYLRLVLWLKTLALLDKPLHFQAVRSAARASFELLMDIRAIAREPSVADKVAAHARISRFSDAEKAVAVLNKHPSLDRSRHQSAFEVANDKDRRDEYEKWFDQYWKAEKSGRRKLPDSWTGKKIRDRAIEEGPEYELKHATDYVMNCKFVHSGIGFTYEMTETDFAVVFSRGHTLFKDCFLDATDIVCAFLRLYECKPHLKCRVDDLYFEPQRIYLAEKLD